MRAPLALALVLASCGGGEAAVPPGGPSVLLVTVDTLRADFLGTYGHAEPTSPAIDAFADEAVVFEDVQASSSWTLPTLASLMTSLYPSSTGCWSYHSKLDPSFRTLAEVLRAAGYDTAAVVSHVFLGRPYGLHQGFTHFDDELVLEMFQSHAAVTSPAITAKGLRWLEAKAAAPDGKPWFLWLHYFDPHKLYREHAGITERFLDALAEAGGGDGGDERTDEIARERAVYEGEIAFTDRAIGEVLAAVERLGLADDTIVVVGADHGEEFLDHGGTDHGSTLHSEVVRVPLLVRAPGWAPRRVAETVRTIDLFPTLLELCGAPAPAAVQGRSLVPLLRGGTVPAAPALAELKRSEPKHQESLVDGRWKLLRHVASDDVQLFDREVDPLELRDVAAEHPDVVTAMARRLDAARAEAERLGRPFQKGERAELTPAELERFEELGYAGDE